MFQAVLVRSSSIASLLFATTGIHLASSQGRCSRKAQEDAVDVNVFIPCMDETHVVGADSAAPAPFLVQ